MSDQPAAATEDPTVPAAPATVVPALSPGPDLDAIERDLADVELALARLDSGEYWRDEVTGQELPDDLLAARPTARRAATSAPSPDEPHVPPSTPAPAPPPA